MRGEGLKCDNCGVVEFIPINTSRLGRLSFLFDNDDEQEQKPTPTPSKWKSVGFEELSKDGQEVDQLVKHYCSTACLEFAVRYIFNKQTPSTYEGDK